MTNCIFLSCSILLTDATFFLIVIVHIILMVLTYTRVDYIIFKGCNNWKRTPYTHTIIALGKTITIVVKTTTVVLKTTAQLSC